ncbi:hypothetical protein M378DRAFT_124024, partial [Amanita muscaria Koide BX008]
MESPVIRTTPIMVLSLEGKQNQPFTEAELDIIRQSRLAAEESLQRVRDEMTDKEEQLSRQIERYTTALSPHNKLPPEILRHIFKCCIQEKQVEEIPVTYKGGTYTISHVCSAWRHIALDAPELWTGIS